MKKILSTLILVISFSTIIFSQVQMRTKFDFDGDGKADPSLFRPNGGIWYIRGSSVGITATQFGLATDKIVPADYDDDSKAGIAVFRSENGVWYILRSSGGMFRIAFGYGDDIPQPADYNGDGKADAAIFRSDQVRGYWYILDSITNSFSYFAFGKSGDIPIPNAPK